MNFQVENMLRKGPFAYYGKVAKDCERIFSALSMTAFGYAYIGRDGRSFTVCTNPAHYEHYYLNDVYKYDPCCNRAQTKLETVNLWIGILNRENPNHELVYQQQVKDNLFNGACIKIDTEFGYETYDFATDVKDPNVLNKFVSNIDLVKHFITYFRSIYRTELEKNADNFIDLSTLIGQAFFDRSDNNNQMNKSKKNSNLIELIINGRMVALTKREAECLYYLCQGKSAKETGNSIFLSNRTVETHLNVLRSKADVKNKFELASKIDSVYVNKLKEYLIPRM